MCISNTHTHLRPHAAAADEEELDEVAVLTQALSSALCTHAEMLVQKAVAERDTAAGVRVNAYICLSALMISVVVSVQGK